ncbi:hypothetical protein ABTW96_33655 [Nocardia beijingensis]|uniref:hypothetical protein n=1 Tax=Nocardia beijingensis TaxID=95162 RepID=UPI00331B642E
MLDPGQDRVTTTAKEPPEKTSMESMRALKRRLSNVVYNRLADQRRRDAASPGGHSGTTTHSSATGPTPHTDPSHKPQPGPTFHRQRAFSGGGAEQGRDVEAGPVGEVDLVRDHRPVGVVDDAGVDAVADFAPPVPGQVWVAEDRGDAVIEVLLVAAFEHGVAWRACRALVAVGYLQTGAPHSDLAQQGWVDAQQGPRPVVAVHAEIASVTWWAR